MDFDLKERTILLTIAGSMAYGTSTSESDVDVKGAAIPSRKYFCGYNNLFEQADKPLHMMQFVDLLNEEEKEKAKINKIEGSIYDIRKFFKLAANSNPNILDLLFCRDSEIRLLTEPGRILRENRNLFISKNCRFTFGGYAHSQLSRIKLHRGYLLSPITHEPTREEFKLPSSSLIPSNQLMAAEAAIRKQLEFWELDFISLEEPEKIYLKKQIHDKFVEMNITSDTKFLSAARTIGYDDNFIYMLQCEREYKSAKERWNKYQEWKKNRNPERAALEEKYSYDAKHAAHLVRLLRMCREILETGKVNVWREDCRELLEIRNGKYSYDELVDWAAKEDKSLDELYKKSTLPKAPDLKKLDELCMQLVDMAI